MVRVILNTHWAERVDIVCWLKKKSAERENTDPLPPPPPPPSLPAITSVSTTNTLPQTKALQTRETDRQTDRQTDRHTGRQAGRQADRQTDRRTDRQTGRIDRHTDSVGEQQHQTVVSLGKVSDFLKQAGHRRFAAGITMCVTVRLHH